MAKCSADDKEIDESKLSFVKQGQKRYIFVLPDSLANPTEDVLEEESISKEPCIVSLRHPRHNDGCLFLLHSHSREVYELKKISSGEPRCWFVETTLLQDGSMYVLTPVDPLFLVLPYIAKATESGKYVPLDDILEDETYFSISELTCYVSKNQWRNVCNVKVGQDHYYSYSQDATLTWLSRKVNVLADKLEEKGVQVGQGSRAALLVAARSKQATREDYVRYACGMFVDYLAVDLGFRLYEHMGISLVGPLGRSDSAPQKGESQSLADEPGVDQPPAMKKMRSEPIGEPLEDYTKYNKKTANQKTTTVKKSAAQRSLERVDKKGMKSIGSFFGGGGGGKKNGKT